MGNASTHRLGFETVADDQPHAPVLMRKDHCQRPKERKRTA